MYPIIPVAANAPEATEPLGTKDKFWYEGGRFLFKQVRRGGSVCLTPNTTSHNGKLALETCGG